MGSLLNNPVSLVESIPWLAALLITVATIPLVALGVGIHSVIRAKKARRNTTDSWVLVGVSAVLAGILAAATFLPLWPDMSPAAQAERDRAVEVIGDAVSEQLALQYLDVDPDGDTAGRPTLAEAPELALEQDPDVAPAVTGVAPDQGLRTYYVMFDNTTGTVDFLRDER